MVAFLFVVALLTAVLATTVIGGVGPKAVESYQARWADFVQLNMTGLSKAYYGYKAAHAEDMDPNTGLPAASTVPASITQLVPDFGFAPRVPQGLAWTFNANPGGQPFLCLHGLAADKASFEGMRNGALKTGAVFSLGGTCGGQATGGQPSSFPAPVVVTLFLPSPE